MQFLTCTIAILVIALVYLVRQNTILRTKVVRDSLTNGLNKVGVEERVKLVVSHFLRSGEAYSYLYLDLQGFKAINDRIGRHQADEILQVLVREVSPRLRSDALFGRLSGDEFLLATPATFAELQCVIERVFVPALEGCNRWARHHRWPAISGRIGMVTLQDKVLTTSWWNPSVGVIQTIAESTVPSNNVDMVMHSMLGLAHTAMECAK